MLFIVESETLQHALTNVLPHAMNNKTLPTFTTVQVKLDGASLSFTATDRYTLARQTVSIDTDTLAHEDGEVLISRADAMSLVKSLQADKMPQQDITIKSDGQHVEVMSYGRSVTFQPVEGTYAQCDRLLDTFGPATQQDPAPVFGVDANMIGRFAKIAGLGRGVSPKLRVEIGATAQKPLRVTVVGLEGFVALVMTFKLGE